MSVVELEVCDGLGLCSQHLLVLEWVHCATGDLSLGFFC